MNLQIKNTSDSFENLKAPPYYLYIEYGRSVFYFSNKKLATRWLSKFKKETKELYLELGEFMTSILTNNVLLVNIIDHVVYERTIEKINYHLLRFGDVLKNTILETQIGREVSNIYSVCIELLTEQKKCVQVNNRNNIVLSQINYQIKQIKRLMLQFELLFSDTLGLKKIIASDSINHNSYLKIA